MHPLIANLKGKLIVSVQAYPGEPMRHPETMAQIARAAEIGGAAAIRCQGLSDISAIKGRVDVPVIGLWKEGHEGVYITPSLRHARACVMAGSDIVALDATGRPRLDGLSFAETVAALREDGTLVMADCGSFEDAQRAVDAGVDIVSTTLAGYTGDRVKTDGPDLELLREVVAAFPDVPVICEGRVHTPEQAAAAIEAGAFAVIVGTAITHPTSITTWFKAAVEGLSCRCCDSAWAGDQHPPAHCVFLPGLRVYYPPCLSRTLALTPPFALPASSTCASVSAHPRGSRACPTCATTSG